MIDPNLNPYPTYKDSGVPWLGDVPAHWEVRRLRNITDMRVSNVDKHVKENETSVRLCNYVDVYKNDYINEQMDFMKATATNEEIERFRLEKDDVLITKDSETWDDIGVPALVTKPASDLILGYHLALLRPRSDKLRSTYLLRALQSKGLAYQFHIQAKGVTRYGLSHAGIKSAWLPLPPLPEQTAIARFLDHADRRIRHYIRAKQKLIALLQEQKQAIIHQAVTGQIDVSTGQPYPAYKPSGVEWLGDVPAHWEIERLKSSVNNIVEQTSEPEVVGLIVALENVESWTGRVTWANFTSAYDSQLKRFRADDILFGKLRPYLAKVTRPTTGGLCVGEFLVLRSRHGNFMGPYLEYLLRSKPIIDAVNGSTFGAKMPRADWQFMGGMPVVRPPLPEQTAIARYLDKATAEIDTAINRTRRQIDLLQEYRTRLIADVVTGKLDVREATAALPEVGPLEAEEGLDAAYDPDAEEGVDELDAIPAEDEA